MRFDTTEGLAGGAATEADGDAARQVHEVEAVEAGLREGRVRRDLVLKHPLDLSVSHGSRTEFFAAYSCPNREAPAAERAMSATHPAGWTRLDPEGPFVA